MRVSKQRERRTNEEKTFTVNYRPDYPEKRLAGKTVEYKVTIEGLKTKEIPELNDDLDHA